jgi:cytidine deaminase
MSAWKPLIEAATEAQDAAYAPYSNYKVGAALLSEGQVYSGCNVENASYGATVCAERHAVAAMVRAGKRKIDKVVVITPSSTPKWPCGLCRQVLAEFALEGDFEILSISADGQQRRFTFSSLHPESFGPEDLDGFVGRGDSAP